MQTQLTPAMLVGVGISYPGNYGSASGKGAITAFDGKFLVLTLEDGRRWKVTPDDFMRGLNDKLRAIYVLDKKFHGAPYLAQLEAAYQLKAANDKAAAQVAHANRTAEQAALVGKVRFMAHYVTDGQHKAKVSYSACRQTNDSRAYINIYAKDYGAQLSRIFSRSSQNDTDSQTDYFCTDTVRIFDDSPLYPAALARVQANEKARELRREKVDGKRAARREARRAALYGY